MDDERYDDAKAIKNRIEGCIMQALSMGHNRKEHQRPSLSKYEDRKVEDPDLFDQQQLSLNNYYRNKSVVNSGRMSRNLHGESLNVSRQDENQIMWLSQRNEEPANMSRAHHQVEESVIHRNTY